MKPLISVIIPVYNADKYIEKCLYSLINQTYKNLELIIINDGSTDKSQKIIESIKLKENRIVLFNQSNSGVSKARNKGLEVATGKYITFIDADDYVDKNYIDILYNSILNNNSDISICKFSLNNQKVKAKTKKMKTIIYNGETATIDMLLARNFDSSVCCKLIESNLAKSEKFCLTMQIAEDCLYYYYLFKKCNKISFESIVGYYYMQNEDGAISTVSDIKVDNLLIFEKLIEESDNKKIKNSLCSKYVSTCFHLLYLDISKLSKEKINKMKQTIKKYRLQLIFQNNVKFKVRIACLLSYFGFNIVNNIIKLRKENEHD